MLPRGSQQYGPSSGHEAAPNAGVPYIPYMVYPHPQMQYPYPPQTNMSMAGPPHMVYPAAPAKYPPQSPLQVPPVPPRRPLPKSPELKEDKQVAETDDILATDGVDAGGLAEVLKPLPPPLEPEKLPSAKIAAVMSSTRKDGESIVLLFSSACSCFMLH